MADTEELWSILLANGDVRTGTLDQLDEAFNAGAVDASTLVLAPGATEWCTLGALAGLDEDILETSPESLRPVAFDFDDSDPQPEPAPARRSRTGWIVAAAVAVLVIGVGLFARTPRSSTVAQNDAPKAAAAAPIAPVAELATPEPESPATPIASAAPAPSAPSAADPSDASPKLVEEQKKPPVEKGKAVVGRTHGDGRDARGAAAKPRNARPSEDPFAKHGKGKCTCVAGDPLCSCL